MHNIRRRVTAPALVVAAVALAISVSSIALAYPLGPPVRIAGNAVAGVRVDPGGRDITFFNRTGGAPAIMHAAGSGVYYIHFPGAGITDGNSILEVTPDTPSVDCTAVNADYAVDKSGPVVAVETKDCSNRFADRGFHLIAYR